MSINQHGAEEDGADHFVVESLGEKRRPKPDELEEIILSKTVCRDNGHTYKRVSKDGSK